MFRMPTWTEPAPQPAPAEGCAESHAENARLAELADAVIPPALASTLAETFRALGDPMRVRILDALSRAELCVCDLARLVGLSESATSHQLRLLRSLRLVRTRRAGRMVYYALDDDHIRKLFAYGLEHVEESLPPSRRQAGDGS
jgi:DNA-binding transcriptional ArsR family regulator